MVGSDISFLANMHITFKTGVYMTCRYGASLDQIINLLLDMDGGLYHSKSDKCMDLYNSVLVFHITNLKLFLSVYDGFVQFFGYFCKKF